MKNTLVNTGRLLALVALCLVHTISSARCDDIFSINFGLQPKGEHLWISPEEGAKRLQLPVVWKAMFGEISLEIRAKRANQNMVDLELVRSISDRTSTLKAKYSARKDDPTAASPLILLDDRTGDTWAVRMSPICADDV